MINMDKTINDGNKGKNTMTLSNYKQGVTNTTSSKDSIYWYQY